MRTILCILLLISTFCFAQKRIELQIENKLITHDVGVRITPVSFTEGFEDYKAPEIQVDSFWLAKFIFDKGQYWFSRRNKIDSLREHYDNLLSTYKIDTNLLAKKELKSDIGIFIGLRGRKKVVIADANHNHNFQDDSMFEFDYTYSNWLEKGDRLLLLPGFTTYFEIEFQDSVIAFPLDIRIKPQSKERSNFKSVTDSLKATYLIPFSYGHTTFSHQGQEFKLGLKYPNRGSGLYWEGIRYNISPINSDFEKYTWLKADDSFRLDSLMFSLEIVEGVFDKVGLNISKIDNYNVGWQEGDYLPNLDLNIFNPRINQFRLTKSDQFFSVKPFTVLDFWGSWCAPCIAEIPNLKKFNTENNSNIRLLSICNERDVKFYEKSKQIIKEKEMDWYNILEISHSKSSISETLNVYDYPTLILIDEVGKIQKRIVGKGGVQKIQDWLKLQNLK
jgi:thiol-disulfide isomerase/thioredoxin